MVQNAPDIIMVVDADLTVRYVSRSVERVLGYPTERFVGTRVSDYLHEDDAERVLKDLAADPEDPGAEAPPVAFRMRRAEGSWRHLEAIGTGMFGGSDAGRKAYYVRDFTERKMLEERLAHQAFHDHLTGLANRRLFMERLQHAYDRTVRTPVQVAVLYLDLDDFKAVNDGFGHEAGDRLLVVVSRRLRGCLRPGDTLARLGGDEFVVLLEDVADEQEAMRVAGRILEVLKEPVTLAGRELCVSTSIGVALGRGDLQKAEDLLRWADRAMYRAKRRGKTGMETFREPHGSTRRRATGG